MAVYTFRTIQTPSKGSYREKGSKFLSFAYPVESEEEIKTRINLLKKEYFDARHHCFAWILGAEKDRYRAFDDGEPGHSAGNPILGQIRSKDLTDLLIVVVRYFGGVKLGVGGLINAYKMAAEDALNHAMVIEKEITMTIHLSYEYSSTPEVMRLVKEFDLLILHREFQTDCHLTANLKLRFKDSFMEQLNLLQATGSSIMQITE